MLREEHVLLQYKVKMVTADDEQTTDIITEGDVEETTRFCRVRWMHASAQLYLAIIVTVVTICFHLHGIHLVYISARHHVFYVHALS